MKNGKKEGRSKKASASSGGDPGDPFSDFLEDFASDPQQPLKFLRSFMAGEEAYNPAIDVVEEKDRILLIADLPGVAEKDLRIEFVEGGVVLRGRRPGAPEGSGAKLRRVERPAGEFTKNVPLPRGLDVQKAVAKIENGVLTLTIPRSGGADIKTLKAGG